MSKWFVFTTTAALALLLFNPDISGAVEVENEFYYGHFPSNFRWGFATSAYQIEGAWNLSGKGENIWDNFVHKIPSPIRDNSTGDVACDSYHKYEQDIQLLKASGAKVYRFSLSWSRILPTGFYTDESSINQAGVDYYDKLLDSLLAANIQPMVTLYHWDLPQPIQELGGWLNESNYIHFANFSRVAYAKLGGKVKEWITFNEPWVICCEGHSTGEMAPGIKEPSDGPYKCGHTILKAHAEAYHIYYDEFAQVQKGRVGITLDSGYYYPADVNNTEHIAAAERAQQFRHGWFGFPIFFGHYPQLMVDLIGNRSEAEGLEYSRLPTIDPAMSERLKGTWDFLGLNHYTTQLTEPQIITTHNGWYIDQDTKTFFHESWPESAANWLRDVPWGFRKLLNWIKDTYDNPEVIITENGYADSPEIGLNDKARVDYFRGYINNMLKAVVVDKCNVTAYTAWSLMDNFEWFRGYLERYGTHRVDFADPQLPRTPKDSAKLLTQIFKDNGFPSHCPRNSFNVFVLFAILFAGNILV